MGGKREDKHEVGTGDEKRKTIKNHKPLRLETGNREDVKLFFSLFSCPNRRCTLKLLKASK